MIKSVQFTTMVINNIRTMLGDEYEVSKQIVVKNNDTKRTGIVIKEKGGSNISPTVYIDDIEGDTKEVAGKVIKIYEENKVTSNFDVDSVANWERAKAKVMPRLVNTELNRKKLKSCVSREFLDLSIIYTVVLSSESRETASVTITPQLLEQYGITEQELYDVAMENIAGTTILQDMNSIVNSMMMGTSEECIDLDKVNELSGEMYVLSCKNKVFGAVNILDIRTMETVRQLIREDLYIIPSSVHEVLIIPASSHSVAELTMMIREVNATEVMPDEVLSDHPYKFTDNGMEMA